MDMNGEEREYLDAYEPELNEATTSRWIGEERIVPLIFAIADRLAPERYAQEGAHPRCSQIVEGLREAQGLGWLVDDEEAYDDAHEILLNFAGDLPEADQNFEWANDETLASARERAAEIVAKWTAELVKYVRH